MPKKYDVVDQHDRKIGTAVEREDIGDDIAGGLAIAAVMAAIAVIAAAVMAVLWWLPRLVASARADVGARRLSWKTIGWGAPVIVLFALFAGSLLDGISTNPTYGGTAISTLSPTSAPTDGTGLAIRSAEPTVSRSAPAATEAASATPSASRVPPFAVPARRFFAAGAKAFVKWQSRDEQAEVLYVGEIDLVQNTRYGSDSAVACAEVRYKTHGKTRSGTIGPIYEANSSGHPVYIESTGMIATYNDPYFKTLDDCVDAALSSFNSWLIAKLPAA